MGKKRKIVAVLLACAIAVVLILRFVGIYGTSDGTVIFDDGAGVSFEDQLSREEVVAVKRILWGKIRWPESLYGFPACGFGRCYAIIIDDTRYMLAWDSCGTLCVEDARSNSGPFFYIDISDAEREVIEEIINSRTAR